MKIIKIIIGLEFIIIYFTGCSTLTLTTNQAIQEYAKVNERTIYEYYDFRLGLISVLGRGKQFNNGLEYVYAYNSENKKCKVEIN